MLLDLFFIKTQEEYNLMFKHEQNIYKILTEYQSRMQHCGIIYIPHVGNDLRNWVQWSDVQWKIWNLKFSPIAPVKIRGTFKYIKPDFLSFLWWVLNDEDLLRNNRCKIINFLHCFSNIGSQIMEIINNSHFLCNKYDLVLRKNANHSELSKWWYF